jgi:hypothetical protein
MSKLTGPLVVRAALQILLDDYNSLCDMRDNTEPSAEGREGIERQLLGMRRQAGKFIEEVDSCDMARWARAFGLAVL